MSLSKPRVLIVEDDHDCRLLLATVVAQAGYEVAAVADGEMALTTMQSRPADLVLLDARLPICDGFAVCRAIKANPATTHTPVIILTAFDSTDARERSLAAGADEFVEKPFRNDELMDLMDQLITIGITARQLDPGEAAVVAALRNAGPAE